MNRGRRRVFRSEEHQSFFDWNGYIVLDDLFKTEDIEQFRKEAQSTLVFPHPVFSRTLESQDVQLKTRLDAMIRNELDQKLSSILDNYTSILGTFIVKEPGETGLFPLHQNPTFVNEYYFQSLVVWMPLVDVNRENGTMFVAPGTNRLLPTYRGIFDPPNPFDRISDHIWNNHLQELELKAGQLVLIDDATLHATPPNLSNQPRIVMGGLVVPKEAALLQLLFEKKENAPTLLHTYHVGMDHFRLFTNKYLNGLNFPPEQLIQTTPFIPYPELTPAAFDALVERRRGKVEFE